MSFISNPENLVTNRQSLYNGSVIVTKGGLDVIASSFDDVLDNFVNFTDTISHITLYPIHLVKMGGEEKCLATVKGNFDGTTSLMPFVRAWDLSPSASYLYLGQIKIQKHFNNFADYSGYTQLSVFLPLLGYVNLDINEVMGKWLQFRLSVDYYSGEGTYIVGVTDSEISIYNEGVNPWYRGDIDADNSANMKIIGNYSTTIGIEIPTGYSNAGDIKRNLILGGVKLATAIYTGVTVSPLVASATVFTPNTPQPTSNLPIPTTGLEIPSRGGGRRITSATVSGGNISVNKNDIGDAFSNSIDALNRIKTVGNSDRADSPMQMFPLSTSIKVVIYRPKLLPINDDYKHLYGEPLGEIITLGDLEGYTEVSKVHFEGTYFGNCTSSEYSLIEQAFSSGVIL